MEKPGKIPKQIINEVIEKADIVELIGSYVELKKSGENYVGLSPFNKEKTPSFTVFTKTKTYKDFSADRQGNVINFIMEMEGKTFTEAMRWLGKRTGVEIKQGRKEPFPQRKDLEPELINRINNFAHTFYMNNFWGENTSYGRDYMESRDFTEETMRIFELGYAPEHWNLLLKVAREAGIDENDVVNAGLANFVSSEKHLGRCYDTFRGRVMFPIHDESGSLVGFGGRDVSQKKNPEMKVAKYLNTRENSVFKKEATLYNFHRAKPAMRTEELVYIVEGYVDVMFMWQAGIQNVVASMGTAFTLKHARALKRFVKEVVVVMDSDHAGLRASEQATDILLTENLSVKLVLIPNHKDPHEYGRNEGEEKLKLLLTTQTQDLIEFKTRSLFAEKNIYNDPSKQARAVDSVVKSIANCASLSLREIYINRCVEITGLSKETLLAELAKVLKAREDMMIARVGEEKARSMLQQAAARANSPRQRAVEKEMMASAAPVTEATLSDFEEDVMETTLALTAGQIEDQMMTLLLRFPSKRVEGGTLTDVLLQQLEQHQMPILKKELREILLYAHKARLEGTFPTAKYVLERAPDLQSLVARLTKGKPQVSDLRMQRAGHAKDREKVEVLNYCKRKVLEAFAKEYKDSISKATGMQARLRLEQVEQRIKNALQEFLQGQPT